MTEATQARWPESIQEALGARRPSRIEIAGTAPPIRKDCAPCAGETDQVLIWSRMLDRPAAGRVGRLLERLTSSPWIGCSACGGVEPISSRTARKLGALGEEGLALATAEEIEQTCGRCAARFGWRRPRFPKLLPTGLLIGWFFWPLGLPLVLAAWWDRRQKCPACGSGRVV